MGFDEKEMERGEHHEKHAPHEKAEASLKKFTQLNSHGWNPIPEQETARDLTDGYLATKEHKERKEGDRSE